MRYVAACLVMWLTAGAPAALAQIRKIVLQPPARDFGYFVGDLVTARALILVENGTSLDAGSVPGMGPAGPSVDIRNVQTVTSSPGQIVVTVTYQLFFSPEQVARTDIPGYQLEFVSRGRRVSATIPGFAVSVSPFRHDLQAVTDPAVLRPDQAAIFESDRRGWISIALGTTLMALGAFALLIGRDWSAFAGGRRTPFAAALRDVSKPGIVTDKAFLALHRAFDATAGKRIFAEDVVVFVETFPKFAGLQAEIDGFFQKSRDLFFGAAESSPLDHKSLARSLAYAEQRR